MRVLIVDEIYKTCLLGVRLLTSAGVAADHAHVHDGPTLAVAQAKLAEMRQDDVLVIEPFLEMGRAMDSLVMQAIGRNLRVVLWGTSELFEYGNPEFFRRKYGNGLLLAAHDDMVASVLSCRKAVAS